MKLELKHLAPYLPYGLKLKIRESEYDFVGIYKSLESLGGWVIDVDVFVCDIDDEDLKPILRPLSDLTKNEFVEDLGEWIGEYQELDFEQIEYGIVANYFKHHFDVFGLIEKGLAIDINTLNK